MATYQVIPHLGFASIAPLIFPHAISTPRRCSKACQVERDSHNGSRQLSAANI